MSRRPADLTISAQAGEFLHQGSAPYWRANAALFAGAVVTFATLYATQPLLPVFTRDFGVSPAIASLALSATTGALAISLIAAAAASEALDRRTFMVVALLAASGLMLLTALSPNFGVLLALRALQGVALAGLPVTALAYLGEEIHPGGLGLAIGLNISGNTLGGMLGRIIIGLVTDASSWRIALAAIGFLSLACSLLFVWLLPPSRHFTPHEPRPALVLQAIRRHLSDPALVLLFAVAFLLMGSFVSLYSYISFQLLEPPYGLSQAAVGWIFLLYLAGSFSSTFVGRLADRVGRRATLWTSIVVMVLGGLTTLTDQLPLKILGMGVFTFGFFGAHSSASSWVARRATRDRSHASALYLLLYYLGSSVVGVVAGFGWSNARWEGVVGIITVLLLVALGCAFRLIAIPAIVPLPSRSGAS